MSRLVVSGALPWIVSVAVVVVVTTVSVVAGAGCVTVVVSDVVVMPLPLFFLAQPTTAMKPARARIDIFFIFPPHIRTGPCRAPPARTGARKAISVPKCGACGEMAKQIANDFGLACRAPAAAGAPEK